MKMNSNLQIFQGTRRMSFVPIKKKKIDRFKLHYYHYYSLYLYNLYQLFLSFNISFSFELTDFHSRK